MKNKFIGLHLDFIGFSASMLCAIHCAAVPFLLTLAPLAGLQFLENPWIEYSIILLSLFIASNALIHGYRKHHKKSLPLMIALAGFLLIGAGHGLATESQEIFLTSVGGVSIAIAHLINWRYIRKSQVEFH
ncbi:MAG TPA: MerC domain-containing protein [Cytophagales bacterium]|nr:MerC domain-containing protein [Cytophagales bacterium]HAA20566.1 MerC domain-containing protein [Cytophagales bacterium]HAP65183.1 MerC domain-containing protein [Cytophagales bacterium]